MSLISFYSSLIIFFLSFLIIILGIDVLNISSSVRKLRNEDRQAFIANLQLSGSIIKEGELLFDAAKKTFCKDHVVTTAGDNRIEVYTNRYKIVQIFRIAHYYKENKLEENYKTLRAFSYIPFLISSVILLMCLKEYIYRKDLKLILETVTSETTALFSISQILTFSVLMTKIWFEIKIISEMLKPKYS